MKSKRNFNKAHENTYTEDIIPKPLGNKMIKTNKHTSISIGNTLKEIQRVREDQNKMYSNIDRFTVQVILTHLHNSPMSADEVLKFQQHITKNITERKVTRLLDDLVEIGYAEKVGHHEYHYTQESMDALENEGITKQVLFN